MRKLISTCGIFLVLIGLAFPKIKTMRPTFSAYTVKTVYDGTPVPPKLSKNQRVFRTMIRRGAKNPVEFAGHYTLPRWGCGAGCNGFAIVDSISGKVYDGLYISELPGAWLEQDTEENVQRMQFNPHSRLLKINACPNEANCGFYDYLMVDGKGLKLIRKELLSNKFQLGSN
ncbi:MAG: hypothetical protein JWN45_539 [Acidobacteriaceae bacterium]|nr:hypothetical protein [Acidobacteriaceae bacterium]